MTQMSEFSNSTIRHKLPLLFAGQAQKEFFVNEALARIDLLLDPVVEALLSDPPAAPEAGSAFAVGLAATCEWAGKEGAIAGWDGVQWTFVSPTAGMVLRLSGGGSLVLHDGWQVLEAPEPPTGGEVIDQEARSAIALIVTLLQQSGLFA